jgi:hypothetical protein
MSSTAGRRQVVFDSRLPVGENTSTNDATHPRNIVLLAANTEAQASADQRYDINPPPRVEGFISYFSDKAPFRRLPFYVNVFLMCLLFVAVLNIKQRVVKIVLAVGIIFVLHAVIAQFGSRCTVRN